MNWLQRIVKRMFFSSDQRYLLEMYNHGYVFESGFIRSYKTKEVVFNDGGPAPWFNYSFLDFLMPRLSDSHVIFEYGLGNSTKYFNTISKHCYGVEHDEHWYSKLMSGSISKDNYYLLQGGEYVKG